MKKIFLMSAFLYTMYANAQTISADRIKKHITYLASDELEGREPGTKGEKLAVIYIEKEFKSLRLLPQGHYGYTQHFIYHSLVSPHDTIKVKKSGTNVIGYLDNGAAKTIVIGAHFDHLGKNGHNSSLDKNKDEHVIHNGADDNASGTAGVLELARYYTSNGINEKCNFLFICFSGEEDGLTGSKHFTNDPTIDLSKIKCMINMDMIGRLNDTTQKLMVYGVGTSPQYTEIFGNLHTDLKFVYDSSGIGPSDQTSFYLKNIPVLHFFTGQHHDYHKSTDDADKINYTGEVTVLNTITQTVEGIINAPEMKFTQTKAPESSKVNFKVTLGIMPDYTYEGEGVKADAVTEGKPAFNAGIKAGDVIIQLGDIKTNNMQSYMKGLSSFKKGDSTQVIVKRGTETLTLPITF